MAPESKQFKNVVSGKAYISHNVTDFEFLYEPFYVAKDIVPPHDERFMGYGYTRNTQVIIIVILVNFIDNLHLSSSMNFKLSI